MFDWPSKCQSDLLWTHLILCNWKVVHKLPPPTFHHSWDSLYHGPSPMSLRIHLSSDHPQQQETRTSIRVVNSSVVPDGFQQLHAFYCKFPSVYYLMGIKTVQSECHHHNNLRPRKEIPLSITTFRPEQNRLLPGLALWWPLLWLCPSLLYGTSNGQ